jgi:hypothetical protein
LSGTVDNAPGPSSRGSRATALLDHGSRFVFQCRKFDADGHLAGEFVRSRCDALARGIGDRLGDLVTAARAIYNVAIADDLIDRKNRPAHRVAKPRRLPSTRCALTARELDQINTTARSCGNDVILDALLRLHTETACRRGGALGIRLEDLDPDRCQICSTRKATPSAGNPSPPPL